METEEGAAWQQLFSVLVINLAVGILCQLEFTQCVLKETEVYTTVTKVMNSPYNVRHECLLGSLSQQNNLIFLQKIEEKILYLVAVVSDKAVLTLFLGEGYIE